MALRSFCCYIWKHRAPQCKASSIRLQNYLFLVFSSRGESNLYRRHLHERLNIEWLIIADCRFNVLLILSKYFWWMKVFCLENGNESKQRGNSDFPSAICSLPVWQYGEATLPPWVGNPYFPIVFCAQVSQKSSNRC